MNQRGRKDFNYYPLNNSKDLDPLIDAIGNARVVLLGEASHGTSEYYTWRTAISRRLIAEKGFNFIAVEGDWPACYQVDRYVKGKLQEGATAVEVLGHFNRWPTWMWGNWEIAALADWLKRHNKMLPSEQQVGFYGLDVYSLWESLQEILTYLEKKDGEAIKRAKDAFRCFEPYSNDPQEYARAIAFVSEDCESEVVAMLKALRERQEVMAESSVDFNAEQNALIAVNAEKYYRAMIGGGGNSWNVRDRHMMETLERLLDWHGPASKAIVWEHNTHVGDARATDMAKAGMVNVGQLAREAYGRENVYIVGMGSYQGSVIAADAWGEAMEDMPVPEAQAGSWEHELHLMGAENKLIFSKDISHMQGLQRPIGHRAIGVVYDPQFERFGNFVPSIIPERYDAFMYIDKTRALHPLDNLQNNLPPDLYPWTF